MLLIRLVGAGLVIAMTTFLHVDRCEAGFLIKNVYDDNAPETQSDGIQFLFKVDKNTDGDLVTKGVLDINDFNFYLTTDSTDPAGFAYTWQDPNDANNDFGTRYFKAAPTPQSIIGETIIGFEYNGPAQLETYIVKAGSNYTVWGYEPGFNIAYFAPDENKSTTPAPGGYPWDESADPITGKYGAHGISHINFYGTTAPVPVPGAMTLLGMGALGMGFLARRRSKPGTN